MARTKRITFTGEEGTELSGRLELPDGPIHAVALFAHCFACGEGADAAARIARGLAGRGIAVLSFGFAGPSDPGGTPSVGDLVRAAEHLRETLAPPSVLIGHSLGGAAVLAAAERVSGVRAVVTIGAPADSDRVRELLEADPEATGTTGRAEVRLAGRPFAISRRFLADIAERPQRRRIAALGVPLLVLHSPQDETIGVESARAIYEAARDATSFVAIDGADHLLTRSEDSGYVADIVTAWAGRSLAAPEASDRSSPGEADGPRATVVTEAGGNGYAQHITIGPHTLVADEPASAGGTDIGPDPYDLLLAALGACTSMTLRMYAQRKGWPLRNATVTLRHSRIHAEDCEHCETEEGRIDHIRREISIEGDLDDDQRAALMEIADKCPVHRTLHSEVVVESHPAAGG